jgi:hypothetical protein
MRQPWSRVGWGIMLTLFSLAGCTREILPTSAAPEPSPAASEPRVAPTPEIVAPTPLPSASPAATSCPSLLGIRVTIFAAQPERDRVVLDATPLTEECAGFPGRLVCPLGQAGSSRRDQCEAVRIGEQGPDWTIEPYGHGSVEALPGTGYLAEVLGRGLVTACSRVQPDVCTYIEIR